MRKNRGLISGYFIGVGLFLLLSMSTKSRKSHSDSFALKESLSRIDTIRNNDSMFTVLTFDDGRLISSQLFGIKSLGPGRTFNYGINQIVFFDNGRVKSLKESCRNKTNENRQIYEEQSMQFDSLAVLKKYQIMEDYKIVCEKR